MMERRGSCLLKTLCAWWWMKLTELRYNLKLLRKTLEELMMFVVKGQLCIHASGSDDCLENEALSGVGIDCYSWN